MAREKRQQRSKPKHPAGNLVGNDLQGEPEGDQRATEPGIEAQQRSVVGSRRPPCDGELSPHELPSEKAKAIARRG